MNFKMNSEFYDACKNGDRKTVDELIAKGYINFYSGLKGACEGGHIELVELMIQKITKASGWKWNTGLMYACEGGHIKLVELMIQKGADTWNLGLHDACKGGHIDIVNLMIAKGARKFNLGLKGACEGGHINTANLMIEKGANDWDGGLTSACQFMIETGARDQYSGEHKNLELLMIQRGVDHINYVSDEWIPYMLAPYVTRRKETILKVKILLLDFVNNDILDHLLIHYIPYE